MQKITVKPLGDLIVMDPATKQPLPPNGAAVMKDNYWRRRIADGDVEDHRVQQPGDVDRGHVPADQGEHVGE